MASATAVVSRRGNDQFRGLFSDTWESQQPSTLVLWSMVLVRQMM
jgi:hypothetical protein